MYRWLVFLWLLLIFGGLVLGDRGMVAVRPGVTVYGPGQKAIVAWNGEEEIIILSTDVYASDDTKVLEVLPLPGEPIEVEKGDFKAFEAVERLINRHGPRGWGVRMKGEPGGLGVAGVEVLIHKRIGAHDLTVVKIKDFAEFGDWVRGFLRSKRLDGGSFPVGLEGLVVDYLRRGLNYFVFDIVDLGEDRRSIDPVVYRFKSKFAYYPLKISQLASGRTNIRVFLVTVDRPSIDDIYMSGCGLWLGYYYVREPGGVRLRPVKVMQFEVKGEELAEIDGRLAKLFSDGGWLTVLRYDGSLANLRGDLVLRRLVGGLKVKASTSE